MADELRVLEVRLYDEVIGHLGNFRGANAFVPADAYVRDALRPVLSLGYQSDTEVSTQELLTSTQRGRFIEYNSHLPVFFANLLPEGALRERIALELHVSEDAEFDILAALGQDLPGAVTVSPTDAAPDAIRRRLGNAQDVPVRTRVGRTTERFSLSGVQLKFSVRKDVFQRYTLAAEREVGDIIVKVPNPGRELLPENEFTAMTLARLAGVQVPDFWLDDVAKLAIPGLGGLSGHFFGIQRFDRQGGSRIHIEDFAQAFGVRPIAKYVGANYESLALVIFRLTENGPDNLREFVRRLTVNILLGNGDAHLKNFSLWYLNRRIPQLAPAYDVVSTIQYVPGDHEMALALLKTKRVSELTLGHFHRLGLAIGFPAPQDLVRTARETVIRARDLWPEALKALPMQDGHKAVLLKRLQVLPLARLADSHCRSTGFLSPKARATQSRRRRASRESSE